MIWAILFIVIWVWVGYDAFILEPRRHRRHR